MTLFHGLFLSSRRAPPPLRRILPQCRKPRRRSTLALTLIQTHPFKGEYCLRDLIPFELKVGDYLLNIHRSSVAVKRPFCGQITSNAIPVVAERLMKTQRWHHDSQNYHYYQGRVWK